LMENTSDSFMPRPLLFCLKSGRSVCYSVPDNNPTKEELKAEIETQKAMFYLQQQDKEDKETE
ncbi:MAG: hypothetical protein KHZ91_10950, partial [Firmicutes bacterium]|nr:hypothetical protein [Bacillota bacterium]